MLALAAVQTAILDVPHLCRIATREHLRHQTVVIGGLIARMGVLKRLPVIGKDLLKDTPVPGGCCKHPRPPSEGEWACDGAVVVPRLLRAVHSSSAIAITAYISNTKNENSYTIKKNLPTQLSFVEVPFSRRSPRDISCLYTLRWQPGVSLFLYYQAMLIS